MKAFVLVLLELLVLSVGSVSLATETLIGSWNTLVINGTLKKDTPWRYYLDTAIRETQRSKTVDPDQHFVVGASLIRPALGYQLDPSMSVYVGYLYQFSEPPYSSKIYHENRYWQQFQHILKTESLGDFQNRMRFEERTVDIGSGTCFRWRQNFKWSRPVAGDWSFILNEEVFYNLNSVTWGPVAGFDQNRLFLGSGYKVNSEAKIELGYLNTYVHRTGKVDLVNNVLAFNFIYNVPN